MVMLMCRERCIDDTLPRTWLSIMTRVTSWWAVESHVPAEGTEQPWRPIFCKAVRSFCVYFQTEVRMIYISDIDDVGVDLFAFFLFPLVSSKL